jgi:hypothetical protein
MGTERRRSEPLPIVYFNCEHTYPFRRVVGFCPHAFEDEVSLVSFDSIQRTVHALSFDDLNEQWTLGENWANPKRAALYLISPRKRGDNRERVGQKGLQVEACVTTPNPPPDGSVNV